MPYSNSNLADRLASLRAQGETVSRQGPGVLTTDAAAQAAKLTAAAWSKGNINNPVMDSQAPWFRGRPFSELRTVNQQTFGQWGDLFSGTDAGWKFRRPAEPDSQTAKADGKSQATNTTA